MPEPDDRKIVRLIRELDAEKVARKKAERHAKLLRAALARERRPTTDSTKPLPPAEPQ